MVRTPRARIDARVRSLDARAVNKMVGIGIAAVGVVCASAVASRVYRGPTGETAGSVPEFPSLDPARWKNGEPQSMAAARGEVVFLEGWSPS